MQGQMLLATLDKFRKYVLKKNLYLIYLLLVISFSLPAIWLQGRTIYFWDGLLPFKTTSDFSYLNFSWNQINGLGYANSIDKYNVYFLSYYFFKIFIKNIAIVQYLLISVLISFSTIGMFLLLKHLNVLLNKNVNDIFPFLGSLFYILNFYFIFTFSNFSSTIYIYSFLPLDVLAFTKAIESINNTKIFFIWTLVFSFLLEVTSYSFLLVPMLLFFLFTIGSFTFIFIKYIKTTKVTLVKYITNISLLNNELWLLIKKSGINITTNKTRAITGNTKYFG